MAFAKHCNSSFVFSASAPAAILLGLTLNCSPTAIPKSKNLL